MLLRQLQFGCWLSIIVCLILVSNSKRSLYGTPYLAYAYASGIDDSNIDLLSRKLQVDFMSNLYADLTGPALSTQSEAMLNQTIITVKPSTSGAAFCTPSDDVFVEAVLLDFRKSVFKSRHFSVITKVAVYVVDKYDSQREPFLNGSRSLSTFTVTVDGKSNLLRDKGEFQMSATVAAGGKSVFLLPNQTALVCVYFPMRRRSSLGIFGVIWGHEDSFSQLDDMQRMEEAISSVSVRHRRSVDSFISSANTTLDLNNGFRVAADPPKSNSVDHPRFLLKERRSRGSSGRSKRNRKFRKYRKRSKSKKSRGKSKKVKEFFPFGSEPKVASKKSSGRVDGKLRRSVKAERRRRRRQNRHKSVKTVAESEGLFNSGITSTPPGTTLADDPLLKREACQRYGLPIRLSELGWKRVIIAPEVVDISYCSGICSAAKTPTKLSNQAMLLQLFKVVRGASLPQSLPEPQCVPNSYSSLTLLYYDEDGNIVLKNYPSMVAKSCGCR